MSSDSATLSTGTGTRPCSMRFAGRSVALVTATTLPEVTDSLAGYAGCPIERTP